MDLSISKHFNEINRGCVALVPEAFLT
jgi:hypothetical protein